MSGQYLGNWTPAWSGNSSRSSEPSSPVLCEMGFFYPSVDDKRQFFVVKGYWDPEEDTWINDATLGIAEWDEEANVIDPEFDDIPKVVWSMIDQIRMDKKYEWIEEV